ncbi:hypothetical protein C5706_33330, partial [Klebsiella pneumoniae]
MIALITLYPGLQQRIDAGAGNLATRTCCIAIWLTVMIALITLYPGLQQRIDAGAGNLATRTCC